MQGDVGEKICTTPSLGKQIHKHGWRDHSFTLFEPWLFGEDRASSERPLCRGVLIPVQPQDGGGICLAFYFELQHIALLASCKIPLSVSIYVIQCFSAPWLFSLLLTDYFIAHLHWWLIDTPFCLIWKPCCYPPCLVCHRVCWFCWISLFPNHSFFYRSTVLIFAEP